MFQGLALLSIGIVVAVLDWFTAKPKPDEPSWPRWAKLACALIVGCFGLYGIFDGYVATRRGIAFYEQERFREAVAQLSVAESSPFSSRRGLDHLGLSYKRIADEAPDLPVSNHYYEKALEVFIKSKALYPSVPYSKNSMINIYRQQKRWKELVPLFESFQHELALGNYYREDDGSRPSEKRYASFLVTLGNVYAAPDFPGYSNAKAVEFYRAALERDPENAHAILNLPPRLLNLAEKIHDPEEKLNLLKEAYRWAKKGAQELTSPADKAFSLLAVIQVLSDPAAGAISADGLTLSQAVASIEGDEKFFRTVERESWLVLADAHVKLGDRSRAKGSLRRAMVHQARFTGAQRQWADRLQRQLGSN
jgi:hypothetical protein